MPKIVNVNEKRNLIAEAACQVIARQGIMGTKMLDIAAEAGVTTGMIANYFENKAAIVSAALRIPFAIVREQISSLLDEGVDDLALLLDATIPTTEENSVYVAVWVSFWGLIASDPDFRQLNATLHAEGLTIYTQAMLAAWPESAEWDDSIFIEARHSIVTFIFGLSAGGITHSDIWTPTVQRNLLRRHLTLTRQWAQTDSM